MNILKRSLLVALLAALSTQAFSEPGDIEHKKLTEIPQAEIVAAIEQGKPISKRFIRGDFLAAAINNLKVNGTSVLISESYIDGDFWISTFPQNNVQFISFTDSIFGGRVGVSGRFDNGGDFSNCRFNGQVQFNNSEFGKSFSFNKSRVENSARFQNVKFLGSSEFEESIFGANVDFDKSEFTDHASFANAVFLGDPQFIRAHFKSDASFYGVRFKSKMRLTELKLNGDLAFEKAVFDDGLDIDDSTVAGTITLKNSTFQGDFLARKMNKNALRTGALVFMNIVFNGRFSVSGSTLLLLRSSTNIGSDSEYEDYLLPYAPVVYSARADFRDVKIYDADFTRSEFRNDAQFNGAAFERSLNLQDAIFEGNADFGDMLFPQVNELPVNGYSIDKYFPPGTNIIGIDFEKKLIANNKLATIANSDKRTLSNLESAYERGRNLDGQNEALYRKRVLDLGDFFSEKGFLNRAELLFWGFGVRPVRLILWMIATLLFFTVLYWFELNKNLNSHKTEKKLALWNSAWIFSWSTAWKFGYGEKHAHTTAFKIITISQSISWKILIVLLLHAISNISPLLNTLVGKFVV